jgi:hypothetical protein
METHKKKLGADHPSTLTREQGREDEAEKLKMQVMETRKRKLGADHPEVHSTENEALWGQ